MVNGLRDRFVSKSKIVSEPIIKNYFRSVQVDVGLHVRVDVSTKRQLYLGLGLLWIAFYSTTNLKPVTHLRHQSKPGEFLTFHFGDRG